MPSADDCQSLLLSLEAARAPADNGAAPAGGANWQDISTAPKDGTRFVAVGQNYGLDSEKQHTCIAQRLAGCWVEVSDWNGASKLKYLTHWMPLPPLPGSAARAPADRQPAVQQGYAMRAAARALSDRFAEMCNVDKEDHWQDHSDDALSDAELVVSTYLAALAPADSVLEDAALLDFIAQHPEMSLRHRKGKWAFVGFTNYEYEMLPSLREAIRAARKQGGAT